MEKYYDVLIMGAGPAGLAAAITVKESAPQLSVLLLEKKEQAAKKLRAAGNGRGNLSNSRCEDLEEVLRFFSQNGIAVRLDSEGRIYPYSEEADAVAEALLSRARGLGVEICTGIKVRDAKAADGKGFRVFFAAESGAGSGAFGSSAAAAASVGRAGAFSDNAGASGDNDGASGDNDGAEVALGCACFLIASGGKSFAAYGSTGDGYGLTRALGHNVNALVPALTAVEVAEDLRPLRGVRAKGIVSLFSGGDLAFQESGEIQFREDALSGICVMNLSSQLPASQHDFAGLKIMINLVPDFEAAGLIDFLRAKQKLPGQSAGGLLETLVKRPLADAVLRAAALEKGAAAASLSAADLVRIANALRGFTLTPTGRKGWKEAHVTRGGVALTEVNQKTLASLIVPGLYFAGEVLDYDGPCGGYNLHHAWLTGIRAGRAMAQSFSAPSGD